MSVGRVFSVEGGSVLDVGLTLSDRTSVTFQVRAVELAVVRLTRRRSVYTEDIYELVLANQWTSFKQVLHIHIYIYIYIYINSLLYPSFLELRNCGVTM